MIEEQDVAKAKHLAKFAAANKRYILETNSELIASFQADLATLTAGNILSTVPATVNGGMWLEVDST